MIMACLLEILGMVMRMHLGQDEGQSLRVLLLNPGNGPGSLLCAHFDCPAFDRLT